MAADAGPKNILLSGNHTHHIATDIFERTQGDTAGKFGPGVAHAGKVRKAVEPPHFSVGSSSQQASELQKLYFRSVFRPVVTAAGKSHEGRSGYRGQVH